MLHGHEPLTIVTAAEKMAADGKYELAASLLEPSVVRFGPSPSPKLSGSSTSNSLKNIRTPTRSNTFFTRPKLASRPRPWLPQANDQPALHA
jgi:hypothetical protein